MTPMVDLAFLLLTFFILTTTFNKDRIMKVTMPDPGGESQPVNDENVLNIVLGDNDRIYWWAGLDGPVKEGNFSARSIRKLLIAGVAGNPSLMILIKPQPASSFQNMVDILDEMSIAAVSRFAIVKFEGSDMAKVAAVSKRQ